MKYPPRRYIVNFVNGSAEFNDDDTPPAEEYLSLMEHEQLMRDAKAAPSVPTTEEERLAEEFSRTYSGNEFMDPMYSAFIYGRRSRDGEVAELEAELKLQDEANEILTRQLSEAREEVRKSQESWARIATDKARLCAQRDALRAALEKIAEPIEEAYIDDVWTIKRIAKDALAALDAKGEKSV